MIAADEERPGEASQAEPKVTSTRVLVVAALCATAVLLLLLAVTARTAPESPVTKIPEFSREASRSQPPPPPPPSMNVPSNNLPTEEIQPPSPVAETITDVIVAVVVVVGSAAVLAIIILITRTVMRREEPEGFEVDDGERVVDLGEVDDLITRSRAELDVGGPVNQAVVRCWEGLEELAENAGSTRKPSQTAREYTMWVLARADLPAEPMAKLADLYEAALFSGEQLPEDARQTAVDSLGELRDAITEKTS